MELTDKERAIINDLINFAWAKGGLTSPQMAQEVEMLRARVMMKPAAPKPPETK